MGKYRRMTMLDRQKIEALWNAGHTYRSISHLLGFAPSSIYREVKRALYPHMGAECTKRPYHYSASIGQDISDYYATSHGVPVKLGSNYQYASYVASRIKQKQSPDVIVASLRRSGQWTVSTTTLYRYIDLGYIPGITNQDLLEKTVRARKKKSIKSYNRLPKGKSIEQRPLAVNERLTFGHWEMDSIIGQSRGRNQSLLVLTERLTRYEIVVRVMDKTCRSTVHALDSVFSKFPKGLFKSITVDNGSEFQDCYRMEHDRQGNKRTEIYYCHPFSSCERGSNERNNRILRRYFPKGKSFEKYTSKDCEKAMELINNMPRKILNYATAAELFAVHLQNFL